MALLPIGQILVRDAGLQAGALEDALAQQRAAPPAEGRGPERLGEILVRMRAVTADALVRGLAAQLGLQHRLELPPDGIDVALATRVPINFARSQRMLPIGRADDGAVLVAVDDPLAVLALDDIGALVGAEVRAVVVPAEKIVEAINKVYARSDADLAKGSDSREDDEGASEELVDILDLTDEAPIIRWVNSLLFNAVREGASDIHVEPQEKEVLVRYRIDGALRETRRANKKFASSITARFKIMAGLNIAEKRLPQDGRIRRRIAGKDIDMRVATAPISTGGERITVRLLDKSSVLLDLADVGFGPEYLGMMQELIERPHGILLVTGPTGSGKTSTLYGCMARINKPDLNILTVEDPVEYQLEGISQVQVHAKIDLTFANALRSFLRHDPDVILVGEIRDLETAEIAIQASLTGHLVFSTVHTNDAPGGITRLVDMGVQPFLVASSVMAILAQRLVRKLCRECREAYRPDDDEIAQLGVDAELFRSGRLQVERVKIADRPPPPGHVYRARGCKACLDTGYKGRCGIFELMMMHEEVRHLALKNADSNEIKKAAIAHGMRPLRQDGMVKVLNGITSIAEVLMATEESLFE